jgi:hypothetical protein
MPFFNPENNNNNIKGLENIEMNPVYDRNNLRTTSIYYINNLDLFLMEITKASGDKVAINIAEPDFRKFIDLCQRTLEGIDMPFDEVRTTTTSSVDK